MKRFIYANWQIKMARAKRIYTGKLNGKDVSGTAEVLVAMATNGITAKQFCCRMYSADSKDKKRAWTLHDALTVPMGERYGWDIPKASKETKQSAVNNFLLGK